ncbi:MAG: hypothetical protein Fur0022_18610 [Anaerolineales bacterium]
MKQSQNSSESGQVLVILVLVIVGLLAFTALAIDGGLIFADRRGAQNAADASVLAGGYRTANTLEDFNLNFNITYQNWNCSEVQTILDTYAEEDALSQAASNGYPIVGESVLDMTCEPGENFGSYLDKYVDTDVQIVTQVDTAFVHFVFGGVLENTVQAISRVRPRMPLAFGYAVYAHRDSCPNNNTGGIRFDGNNQVTITGGGIMSDACIDANGSSLDVDVTGGNINYITEYTPSGSPSVSPSPTQQLNKLPDWALLFSEPDCSDLPASSTNGDGTISAGVYSSGISVTGNEQLTLNPGLYCLDDDFTINGNNDSYVIGSGVTIFMRNGDLTSNGNATVRLSAPNYVVTANDGITGMLIYLGADNNGEVNLSGNSESYYSGTIFGVHEDSRIEVGGTGDLTSCYNNIPCFGTQLIAGTVKIHGNAVLDIDFLSNAVYYLPARLTLEK